MTPAGNAGWIAVSLKLAMAILPLAAGLTAVTLLLSPGDLAPAREQSVPLRLDAGGAAAKARPVPAGAPHAPGN